MFKQSFAENHAHIFTPKNARVIPFLENRSNQINVSTVGYYWRGRSAVSICVSGALGTLPKQNYWPEV